MVGRLADYLTTIRWNARDFYLVLSSKGGKLRDLLQDILRLEQIVWKVILEKRYIRYVHNCDT